MSGGIEPTGGGGLALLGETPEAVLRRASELAEALGRVVRSGTPSGTSSPSMTGGSRCGAWQVLGAFVGVAAVVERTMPLADGSGYEARAVVRTRDGLEVAAGEGMCSRAERNWRVATDHSLRAMAQTRALRRALQGALGWIPGLAGMDVSDPGAPATRRQVVALHTLASELGWDDEERHARAGVRSFNDLTREQAGELLEAWSALLEDREGEASLGTEHRHRWEPVPGRALVRCTCGAARRVPAADREGPAPA